MAQQNNKFSAFFGVTGLSPTINIRDVSGNLVVDNVAMTELGGGWYVYQFTGYNSTVDYVYDFNPNNTLYSVQSGVTDKRLDYLDKPLSGIIGSFNIKGNKYDFGIQDRDNIEKLLKEIDDKAQKNVGHLAIKHDVIFPGNDQKMMVIKEISQTVGIEREIVYSGRAYPQEKLI